jgi:hypothetical protein
MPRALEKVAELFVLIYSGLRIIDVELMLSYDSYPRNYRLYS